EVPRLYGPGRRLDLQIGTTERALGSVVGHHDEVVVPSHTQVDRADRHLLPKWRERLPHMLRLREYVEDELDRSVELSGKENLEITREFDDCRPVPIRCHCRSLLAAVAP